MTAPGHHNPPARIRATLLGKVRISVGDRMIADDVWTLRSARALLLLLLITPGHALSSERVRDILWPEATPEVGRNALYKAIHLLRRVLEPELASARASTYIESRGGTIAIAAHVDVRTDADVFENALRKAAQATDDDRRGALREAANLYGGELLPTDRYDDWPIARREGLRYAWESAVLDLADMDLEAGEPQASVPTLELLLAADPTAEAAHRALMQGYFAAGQRDRAIRQYARCVTALANQLGVEPDAETQALYAAIQQAADEPATQARSRTGPFNNLPAPPTAIVGRDREIEALQGTLWRQNVRLVTLVGPGGVGKTRLAIEAASQLAEDLAGGVAFVPLAAVRDPSLVLQTIANTLELHEEPNASIADTLVAHLRSSEMLLVLDNFEQVLGAARAIGDLLARCPSLTVLVTSRERLHLRGEHLHEVAPLSVPRPERLPAPGHLARYGSVALFIQHMQHIDSDFEVTPENSEVVSAICRHLEGLPLAIELATARARFFSLGGLLARLARRLDIDEGPRDLPARQRTLRATFAWSHGLLSPAEKTVFRRLGVAVGGCSRDAAVAICGDEYGELDMHLRSLAEKHMIQLAETDDGLRVTLLETIREFAIERLEASGEAAEIERRHAGHYLALAARAEPRLVGSDQVAWFERLETEQGNLRAALGWSLERAGDDAAAGVRGAVALRHFWSRRRTLQEGVDWLERALARPVAEPRLRARVLVALANLHEARSAYARAEELIDEALPLARKIEDQAIVADALGVLGDLVEDQGDFPRASAIHHEVLELYRAAGLRRESAMALGKLAIIAYYQSDFVRASELWEECLVISRELEDHWATGVLLGNLGAVAMTTGDYDRAVTLHEENLAIARRLNDRGTIGRELLNLAEAMQVRGDGDQDALLDEALDLQRETSDQQTEISTLALIADNALRRGELRRAAHLFARSVSLCQSTGDRAMMANAALLERCAELALESAQAVPAARLLGAARSLRSELEAPIMPYLRPISARCLTQLRERMKVDALDTALGDGMSLSMDAAIETALAVCERAQTGARPDCAPRHAPLSVAPSHTTAS
jgi:predicted ATPase/DNA-binding SARP family transcriptional activator